MKCPTHLTGEAKKFFNRHRQRCLDDGSLNEATVDSFLLLCRTWGYLAALDPTADPKGFMVWNGTVKTFERQGIPFGITSKKRSEKPMDLNRIIAEGLADAGQDEEGEAAE